MENNNDITTDCVRAEGFFCGRCRQERNYFHGYHILRLPAGNELECCGNCASVLMAEQPGAVLRRVLLAACGEYTLARVDGTLVLEEKGKPRFTEDDGDVFHHHVGVHLGAEAEIAVAVGIPDGPVGVTVETP